MTRSLVWQLTLGLAAVALLTLGPAIFQGRFANRWQLPDELVAAANALQNFPKQIGSWEAADPGAPLSDGVMQELGLAGYVSRFYRQPDSEEVVLLVLMVGQPGPMVRHPPDICFGNQANTLLDESRINVAPRTGNPLDKASEFRVLKYQHDSQLRDPFRVAYAFTTDGKWEVPRRPRITFGAYPALYKVHIQAMEPLATTPSGELPIEDFVRQFVAAFAEFQQVQAAPPR